MSRRTGWILLALIVAAPCAAQTSAPTATPPDFPRGRISGYMFGDYYYNLLGDPNHVYDASGTDLGDANIDASAAPIAAKDLNGFQLRRMYFQLDNDLSIRYATRVRLEADSKSLTSDAKIGVNVKAAYLQAKSVIPRGDVFFGILTTPIWEASEEFWQYRSLEKTIADFRGLGSSADVGLELKGFVDSKHKYGYSAMVGNGIGQKTENNRFKKLHLALPSRFGDLRVEPYVDYESERRLAGRGFDKATYKLFAGYELRKMAVGVEAVDRVNHRGPLRPQEPRGVSVYVRGTVTPTIAAVARFDNWQSDKNLGNRIDSQLWIAGIDWQPYRDVHVIPNVEATQYISHGNPTGFPAHHEIQGRITFYYRFSRPQSS